MRLSDLYWHRITPLHSILWPLSFLYRIYLALKRLCYWLDILTSVSLPVPVMMIDSFSIDNSSKTPLTMWLINYLIRQGYRPGIITRGNYGNHGLPTAITSASDLGLVEEEIFILAQRYGETCPVWVGSDRIAVAQALLDSHPLCNIIISNNGLHYYRLEYDIEIIVVDFSEQSLGNGLILPAGPLRISPELLKKSEIIVANNKQNYMVTNQWGKIYNMTLTSETAYKLLDPEIRQPIEDLRNKRLHVIARGDNVQWLSHLIRKTGLNAELYPFSESHRFIDQDLHFPETDIVLMPEKDALQCNSFAKGNLWALSQEAWANGLEDIVQQRLRNKHKQFIDSFH